MLDVLIALAPAVAVAVWFYGWAILLPMAVCIASCYAVEIICTVFLLKRPLRLDPSAAVTGLLLALNLPPNAPWWIGVAGSIVAIGIGKMTFGGLGRNIFNPALVGRVFLLVSFPVAMTDWSLTKTALEFSSLGMAPRIEAFSGATHLAVAKAGAAAPFTWDMALLRVGGCIGELSAAALLAGFVYLLVRKVIKPTIPLTIVGTVALVSAVFNLVNPEAYTGPLFNIFTGGVLLGAIFMATDYVTSPMTCAGQIVYGVGIGLIIMMIRYFGAYPEGVSFSILIMNCAVPLIDKYFHRRTFAKEVRRG